MRSGRWDVLAVVLMLAGCGDDAPADTEDGSADGGSTTTTTGSTSLTTTGDETESDTETGEPVPELELYDFANGCYSVRAGDTWLTRDGDGFAFAGDQGSATPFFLKAADLGQYLLYDAERGYVYEDGGSLERRMELQSDVTEVDDDYVSGAVWVLERSEIDPAEYHLRNARTQTVMTDGGALTFEEATGCTEHPELTLDAEGSPTKTTFDDGDLYGIVDTHSHILSNFAFGGGGVFHGAPFHPLGVEHALSDCEQYHGEMGRKDFFGYVFDQAGSDGGDITSVLPLLLQGELDFDNHPTAGYPEFTDWPNAPTRSTHQTQYYKWLERAHLAGLRLVVFHATTNSIICHINKAEGIQETRYDCEDMTAVDRIIEGAYDMERYIDAQAGGPGEGWFRVVLTPEAAREVIAEGKMAVVLGIETSNLFECTSVPREGFPTCDEAYVVEQLDRYQEAGIRVIFPVHKYDNAFSAGDGDRAFIELGNLANSGHWSSFTLDGCPDVPPGFDGGDVFFGGLNQPRDEYFADPPNDVSNVANAPLAALFPLLEQLGEPPLEGDYCQSFGLTPLGEFLMQELMRRGMVIEVDHFSRRSYARAFEILSENDYPAAGTHGRNNRGELYSLGGVSKMNLGRCRSADGPGAMTAGLLGRVAEIEAAGGYPAEGFGFDLNGFAGAPGPRFGEDRCSDEQEDPITYPFTSVAGDVTFTEPVIGDRVLDFNTEGMVHIGLLPELIEDARRDAASETDLDPLFRSAEGYIRMWEKSESRGAEISGG